MSVAIHRRPYQCNNVRAARVSRSRLAIIAAGIIGLYATAIAHTADPVPQSGGVQGSGLRQVSTAPPPASIESPLDTPLRLIDEATRTFQNVRDYSCVFVKREQVQGRLQPENIINMQVRNQPFSVYMKWLAPQQSVGQEVSYIHGWNNNQMRVHSPGILGAVGFVSIDPRDPRAMEASRHAITEAGIGNLIGQLRTSWEQERRWNKTQVRVAEYEFNKRRCTRVEAVHPERNPRQYSSYRTIVYFDKEVHLPVRVELYDWPMRGGAPEGDLQECYSYVDLRFNLGLSDRNFRY